MDGAEVALAALGIMATIVGVLVWLVKKLFNQNDTTLKQVSATSLLLSRSIDKLAVASDKQTTAIEKQEKATLEWQKYVTERFNNLDEISKQILSQTVSEQTVQHQTVLNTETKQ